MTDLSLENRAGLPDALRVLAEQYPRTDWEHDPGFEGLLRFWLDRHLMFRKILNQMTTEAEKMLDHAMDPQTYAAHLARYGGIFVEQLHGHHTIEDTHYFPKLIDLDPRVSKGFDILDRDHHAIDGYLNSFVGAANNVLQTRDQVLKMTSATEALRQELIKLERLLDRHLIDEEELVVPVVLKYGAPEI